MSAYDLLKFVHIGFAICWLGGATALTLLVAQLARQDRAEAGLVLARMPIVASRLFGPGGMGAVATGLLLGWLGGWFPSAWIMLSIVIVGGLIVMGMRLLDPIVQAASAAQDAGDLAAVQGMIDRFLRLAILDVVLQWAVVSLMVLKPGWADPALAVPAAILLVGGALVMRRPAPVAQPAE